MLTKSDERVIEDFQGCASVLTLCPEDQPHQVDNLVGEGLSRGNQVTLHVLILVMPNLEVPQQEVMQGKQM